MKKDHLPYTTDELMLDEGHFQSFNHIEKFHVFLIREIDLKTIKIIRYDHYLIKPINQIK